MAKADVGRVESLELGSYQRHVEDGQGLFGTLLTYNARPRYQSRKLVLWGRLFLTWIRRCEERSDEAIWRSNVLRRE